MLKKGGGPARSKGRPLEKGLCIHFPCRWGSVHTRCSMPLGSFAQPSNYLFNNVCSTIPTVCLVQFKTVGYSSR